MSEKKIKKIAKEMIERLNLQPDECFLGTITRDFEFKGFTVTLRLLTADEVKEVLSKAQQEESIFSGDLTQKIETLKKAITKIEGKSVKAVTTAEIEKLLLKMPATMINNIFTIYSGFDLAVQMFMSSEDVDFFSQRLLELRRLSEQQVFRDSETGET